MQYPSAEEYIKAVQHPATVFRGTDLKKATFDIHPLLQIPVPASGSSAVVFKAHIDGRAQALRFFTRDDSTTRERYTELNTYFVQNHLAENVAACRWIDDAISVGGRTWPVVRMDWVDGRALDQYVEGLIERRDHAALGALAQAWRELLRRMQAARFAHGDLQHGNVLVDQAGMLRLVDFDGAWITPFTGSRPPSELGHRNYQHPGSSWGPWMDTFPGLVVYVSLLTLAKCPEPRRPWEELNNGENLLFRQPDFDPPFESRVWTYVAETDDPELNRVAGTLRSCCTPGWSATCDLEQLLGGTRPWWELTRTPAAGKAHAPAAARMTGPLPPPPRMPEPTVSEPIPVTPSAGPRTGWWPGAQVPQPRGPQPPPPQAPEPSKPPVLPALNESDPRRLRARRKAVLASVIIGLVLAGAASESATATDAPGVFGSVWLGTTLLSLLILLALARRA